MGCPHSRSRDQHSVGGHPREVRWTVPPSEGKDTDSSDSRKTLFLFFDFSVEFFGFLFLFPFIPLSIVVVDFLGTMKSN